MISNRVRRRLDHTSSKKLRGLEADLADQLQAVRAALAVRSARALPRSAPPVAVSQVFRETVFDALVVEYDLTEQEGCFKRLRGYAHLFGRVRDIGYFAVVDGAGLGVLDRDAFRVVAIEARAAEILPPFQVFARVCTYSGPGLTVVQPGQPMDQEPS